MQIPHILYGTAWKEDQTERLTEQALQQGFRGIDTANQRKHYVEAAVGRAVRSQLDAGTLLRSELFLQTKFTFRHGQDERLPYDPNAPIGDQVRQSFAVSLEHLGVDRIDSYVLHGPSQMQGLGPNDWAAWNTMEAIQRDGGAEALGVSNITLDQLRLLVEHADIQPRFVQNRCFATTGWDRELRAYCTDRGIRYQGFSLLTANVAALRQPSIASIARQHGRTIPQIVFRFAFQCGMIALTGTTNSEHMRQDLDVLDFELEQGELQVIEGVALGK